MNVCRFSMCMLIAIISIPAFSHAQSAEKEAIRELKEQLQTLKSEYENRIRELELQMEELQVRLLRLPEAEAVAMPAPPAQTSPGILNPAISVIGNFLGRADSNKVFAEEGERIDDRFNLRETEIDFRTAVDPYADGVLILAFESEVPGDFSAGVEEGYVRLKKLPLLESNPLGLKFKMGRFRPAFGRSNILHLHDLPTSFYPLPVEEFLGEEGFVQSGISTQFFLPTPWDESSSLDATFELLTGGDIAFSPGRESPLSYLGHLRWFRTFQGGHDLELGWSSYFHPSGEEVESASAHGLDFLYRWKPARQGQWKSFLIGAEFLFVPDTAVREEDEPDAEENQTNGGTPAGYTLFGQWQFNRRVYAGLKYDRTETLLNSDLTRTSLTPYVSLYFSEFLRLRFSYERRWSDLIEEDGRDSLFLELNWIFGSHPPEPYWVNK